MMDTQTNTRPEPGIYYRIPMDAYHLWDCASQSRLNALLRSPAHCKAYMEEPPDSVALRFGRAVHMAVLEFDKFSKYHVVASQCSAETKAGKRCSRMGAFANSSRKMYCSTHFELEKIDETMTVLSETDYESCIAIRDAIHSTTRAAGLIKGKGEIEISILWDDEETGVPCKARWDRYSPDVPGGAIIDLKTTRDASPQSFEKTIFNYGYHRQGAFYLRAAKAHSLPVKHYVIIAVEKTPPYGVGVYRLLEAAIDAGEHQVKYLMKKYAECIEKDSWPCYPDEVRDIGLPDFAWHKIEEEISWL